MYQPDSEPGHNRREYLDCFLGIFLLDYFYVDTRPISLHSVFIYVLLVFEWTKHWEELIYFWYMLSWDHLPMFALDVCIYFLDYGLADFVLINLLEFINHDKLCLYFWFIQIILGLSYHIASCSCPHELNHNMYWIWFIDAFLRRSWSQHLYAFRLIWCST